MKEKIIFDVPVRLKSESLIMKIINFFIYPFNPNFMDKYWTTLFTVVYAPKTFNIDDKNSYEDYRIRLEHEKVHIQDFKQYNIVFLLSYLLPYFRFVWERRAYKKELQNLKNNNIDLYNKRLNI